MIFRPFVWERRFVAPRDPGTLAIASFAAAGLGTGMQVLGQVQQANAQAGQANYMAQVARRNQMLMEENARRAEEQGRVAEETQRLKTASLIGSQRAALASQGGDVNSGSPLDIQTDTARAGEFDALTIRHNSTLQAYGFRLQGVGAGASAGNYEIAAANATSSLPFGIGSSLLGGASSIAGKWADWQMKRPVSPSYGPEFDL